MDFKLIVKKLNNTLSADEEIIFSEWYNEAESHKEYFHNVQQNYLNDPLHVDIENGWKAIEKKITPPKKRSSKYLKYAVAASILLFISIPFLLKKDKTEQTHTPAVTTINNTIKIGTDKSTLTLEDGTVVNLEKGKEYISNTVQSDGKKLVYTAPSSTKNEITYNYLTIPRGGQYHIVLADGTNVWLNSESQLRYPVSFPENKTRQVELVYGEAYFEVSPSTKHQGTSFKVRTDSQEVEVLGTAFNIAAYKDDEAIYTTLAEGKIAITNGTNHTVLHPNQQAIIRKDTQKLNVVQADVFSATSWRKGIFSFNEIPLENIMKVLARWYDVEVEFTDPALKSERFSGILRKNQHIEDILNSIQTIINNAYVIKDNTILFK
ncbi:DUF4974 domain-containing protein [Flavobacteriaceae bacterium F08102]|nr:DUF4974 domain-containing protein [Flavobacteriaceae bacterium F08102]